MTRHQNWNICINCSKYWKCKTNKEHDYDEMFKCDFFVRELEKVCNVTINKIK